MSSSKGTEETSLQMDKIRHLLLGEDNQLVRDTVEENAREIVSNVLTEALHDRQKNDGTVSKVLTPLVEKSVEASVVARKEQFVSYLYPLVGSLVRKSVSSFLSELVEQTNALLESSLTYKGLKWRFKARQAGVSYSQYVVSQTFLFRVEQVLLIHHETGLLLKTVVKDKTQAADADMVSAMLTAINDFVSDSFSHQEGSYEQQLDEIKTDDFTLLIKKGPRAFLVAAVTGKVPANISDQLQLTLEDIHRLYGQELQDFEGDATPFDNAEQQLNDCLLAQYRETTPKKRKTPWMAILLSMATLFTIGYYLVKQWQLDYQAWQIQQLPTVAGIILLKSEPCDEQICVEVLKDPAAQPTLTWIQSTQSSFTNIQLTELPYQSLEPELMQQRLIQVSNNFPELTFQQSNNTFQGELSAERFRALQMSIAALPKSSEMINLLNEVTIKQAIVHDTLVNRFLLEKEISDIESTSVSFDIDESELTETAKTTIKELSKRVISMTNIALKLNQNIQLVAMGISDSIGTTNYNQKLSAKRANAVRDALIREGVNPTIIKSVGLGIVNSNEGSRRVIFGVIKFLPENIK